MVWCFALSRVHPQLGFSDCKDLPLSTHEELYTDLFDLGTTVQLHVYKIFNIVVSLCDRVVACPSSESCVWKGSDLKMFD